MREVSDRQPKSSRARWHAFRHFAFSAALWITYALYWRVVLVRGVEREARIAGILLALFLVLQVLLTQTWVAHNRSLARRHAERRRARPAPAAAQLRDFLGRDLRVLPTDSDLTRVPVVVVRVDGEEKSFEAGLLPSSPEESS
jgi:hypothetical protein